MMCSTFSPVRDLLASGRPAVQAPAQAGTRCIFRLRPVMMLSSTVMPLNSAMFWNVRAMPMRGRFVRVHAALGFLAAEVDRALLRADRRR